MRLILDSHILLAIALRRLDEIGAGVTRLVTDDSAILFGSTASLWEIAIKARLGKLDPGMALADLPRFFENAGITIMPITAAHALAQAEPVPPTRDPFDRMLLAQCAVEGCRLVTLDRALAGHPLAARIEVPADERPTRRNPRTRR